MLTKILIYLAIACVYQLISVYCQSEEENKSSLTFVIDDTGSMGDDIEQVKQQANDIFDTVYNSNTSQIDDFILVTFNDPDIRLRTKTRSKVEFKRKLASIYVDGGLDCPEMAMKGIEQALHESRYGSYLYVFTDATAKDYYKFEQINNIAQKKQCQINFILTTSNCRGGGRYASQDLYYHYIAEATNGLVFDLENKRGELNEILKTVREAVKGRKTVISTSKFPAGSHNLNVTVDSKMKELVISVTGNRPKIDVYDPYREMVSTEDIANTANVKVVKVPEVQPGVYTARVTSNSKTRVLVTGSTSVHFKHGFAGFKPTSFADTTTRPILGEKEFLYIKLTSKDTNIELISVQILDMDGKVISEMLLEIVDHDDQLYVTEGFIAPSKTFQIGVVGKGKYSHKSIKRISKTPIQPIIKDFEPIVTVDQIKNTYEYNSKLDLICNVKGHPKPEILWIEENGNIVKTANIWENPPYEYSSQLIIRNLKKSQRYRCHARNQHGTNIKNVFVNVKSPFFVSKHIEDVTNVAYEKRIELICDIKSKWPMKITWWKNGKLVTSHVSNDGTKLRIEKANINDQGNYICEAKLSEDSLTLAYQTELKISGLISPHIEKQTSFLIIKKAETVTLTCKITKGFPAPKRVWQFKDIGSNKWITIANSKERLTIERTHLRSGNYKCIASNVIGDDAIDIHLAVEVPPEIVLSQRTVSALELDLVLRIPCDTVGYPKPTVTWRINGRIIKMDKRYKLDKNTLVILNPVKNDSGNYTCEVQNQFGSDSKITEAIVKSNDIQFLINPSIEERTTSNPNPYQHIEKQDQNTKYVLEGSIISLDCPHLKYDAVRWYKNYQYLNITGSPLVIKKATTQDDGVYICRASNYYGTQSHSFKINVGYGPRGNTDPVIINKDGRLDQTLSVSLACQFDVKPMTNEIEWTFNGEMINENTTDFNGEINWGIYTCSITNPHGTAKKTFTVISNDCLIKKTLITQNAPLILTEDSSWPDIYYNENYLRLPRNMNSKLFCRSQKENHFHFESFSMNNEILATCVSENKFSVNGTIVKFEDLQCNLPIRHIINETGATCFNENTELVKVGFEVDKFVEVYEVCVDKTKMVPLYTRIDMTPVHNVKSTQFATARVNEIHGDKCGEDSKCCFGKTQLVGERDVRYGPSQAATLIDMNSVPYWRPCDEKLGWNDIAENITTKLEQNEGHFIVWSGASNYTTKSDVTIPRYLWKVINDVDDEHSFSIVYVNDPTPTVEDKLCEDICSRFDWITCSDSIYCCQLEEFQKAFGIPKNLQ